MLFFFFFLPQGSPAHSNALCRDWKYCRTDPSVYVSRLIGINRHGISRPDFSVAINGAMRPSPHLILTIHLARFNHQPIWQKGNMSNHITKRCLSFTLGCFFFFFFSFFLWLNPYHRSPSGLLAPDATARLFSDWAIWAALCWSSIESKYRLVLFLVGIGTFLNAQTPSNLNTHSNGWHRSMENRFLGTSACASLSWKREDSVTQRVLILRCSNYN